MSTYTTEPSGDGTRLTSNTEITRRFELLERLENLIFIRGQRDRLMGKQLALIKRQIEARHESTPAVH